VLSANERKDKIPAQLFTYFDPAKTIRDAATEPIPVKVEGGAAERDHCPGDHPSPQNRVRFPSAAPGVATGNPSSAHGAAGGSAVVHAAVRSAVFLAAQLIPLVALLGFIIWKIRVAHLNNRELQRREALQHEGSIAAQSAAR
jgi:hypothetical protein